MAKGKGLFPRRPFHKGENGTQLCAACPDDIKDEPIVIIFDKKRPLDDHAIKGHLRCGQRLLELASHWISADSNSPQKKV